MFGIIKYVLSVAQKGSTFLSEIILLPSRLRGRLSLVVKAIGRAKAGRGEEPVAKFRKFKKTENTFTLKIRET